MGRVVRGYLLNQIRASMSGAVVQALSSHQCSHPTGKSSREAGKGGGGLRGYLHNQIRKEHERRSGIGTVSHQCGPGSNASVNALLQEDFSPPTSVFSSPQKQTMTNSYLIWNARTRLNGS